MERRARELEVGLYDLAYELDQPAPTEVGKRARAAARLTGEVGARLRRVADFLKDGKKPDRLSERGRKAISRAAKRRWRQYRAAKRA